MGVLKSLKAERNLPLKSPLRELYPFVDTNGLLRVGGRIIQSKLEQGEVKPIIIPGRHHVAILIVRHYHEAVKHRGRHFTEGAIRAAGVWLIGAKRVISSLLYKGVTCRKLHRATELQQMADLPRENVGVFGPWEVVSRRTRGRHANSKRWAVMFSCLCTRAVRIEVIETMNERLDKILCHKRTR